MTAEPFTTIRLCVFDKNRFRLVVADTYCVSPAGCDYKVSGMELFRDREQGPRAKIKTTIDRRVERAIVAVIRSFQAKEAFGIDFPSICPDGAQYDGTDTQTFEAALCGAVPEMEGWIKHAISSGGGAQALIPTGAILDALEWLASHVAQPEQGYWHSYHSHHHLNWEREEGLQNFCKDVNAVFSRNGLAYEMAKDGRILRVVEGLTAEALARAEFTTEDSSLDQLLETAQRHFFERDPERDNGRLRRSGMHLSASRR